MKKNYSLPIFVVLLSTIIVATGIISVNMWCNHYMQKQNELIEEIQEDLQTALANITKFSYENKITVIQGEIEEVYRTIFAEQNLIISKEEHASLADGLVPLLVNDETIYLRLYATADNHFIDSIVVDPEKNNILVEYSYEDVSLIADIVDHHIQKNNLQRARENLKSWYSDAQRLGEMILGGEYIEPQPTADQLMELINIVKKLQWEDMADMFEKAISERYPDYEICFKRNIDSLSQKEIDQISALKICIKN